MNKIFDENINLFGEKKVFQKLGEKLSFLLNCKILLNLGPRL